MMSRSGGAGGPSCFLWADRQPETRTAAASTAARSRRTGNTRPVDMRGHRKKVGGSPISKIGRRMGQRLEICRLFRQFEHALDDAGDAGEVDDDLDRPEDEGTDGVANAQILRPSDNAPIAQNPKHEAN